MTDTMQALYRYTAEGRFSSYLTGADYREVCRVLDKLEQTLRQLLPAGERDLLSRLDRRPGGPVTRVRPSSPAHSEAPAPVLRLPSRRRSGPSAGDAAPRRAGPQAPPRDDSS